MLRVWNMVLVALAFELAIFGDFLTRSGVINSIHSFAQSSIGAWFLGFVVATTLFSVALILWRLPLLRARTKLESPLSREATFLYNNLLLVALCLTVLWGVLFPILTELFLGQTRTIGRPYYDFFLRIFGLPLLLLMGIGPLVAWRRSSLRALGASLVGPALFALACGLALLTLGAGSSVPGLVAYTFCAFVLAAIVLEFSRGTRARKALGERTWLGAFNSLVSRNRRRYGGYVVHAAIVLLAVGVAGSSAYGATKVAHLRPGQSMQIRSYTLVYHGWNDTTARNHVARRAHVDVYRGGSFLGSYDPGKNSYFAEQQTSNEVAIRSDWLRAEDLFMIGDQFNSDGSVYLKVLVHPLVNLIWLAGLVFLAGSLIAMWPDARERRRLVSRFRAEAPAPAHGLTP
jgi:cytochrome c-type biogenesis protein CcmF